MTLIRRYKKSSERDEPFQDVLPVETAGNSERLDQLETDIRQDEVAFRGSLMLEVFVDAGLRGTTKAALKETRDNLAYLELLIANEKELFKILVPFITFFYIFFHTRNLLVNCELDKMLMSDPWSVWTRMMWSVARLLRILGVLRLVFLGGAWIRNCFMKWEIIADDADSVSEKQNTIAVVDSPDLDAGLRCDCIGKYYEKTKT